MRSFHRALLGLVLVGSLALPVDAPATSLAPLSIEQITDAATWVIQGTVQEVWTDMDAHGTVWTHARVTVSDSFKGNDTPTEIVIDQAGGKYGVVDQYVPGSAGFTPTEEILAFVYKSPATGRTVLVSKWLGKYVVRRAPGDTEPYVRTWQVSARNPYDGRFLPHPAPEDRVYLSDLVAQVEGRVVSGWDGAPIPGVSDSELARINASERRIPR